MNPAQFFNGWRVSCVTHDPTHHRSPMKHEVAERITLLYSEILIDGVGHVGYCRVADAHP